MLLPSGHRLLRVTEPHLITKLCHRFPPCFPLLSRLCPSCRSLFADGMWCRAWKPAEQGTVMSYGLACLLRCGHAKFLVLPLEAEPSPQTDPAITFRWYLYCVQLPKKLAPQLLEVKSCSFIETPTELQLAHPLALDSHQLLARFTKAVL